MQNEMAIAERIKRLLAIRHMSQRALARGIHTSDAAVSKYLSGERRIRPSTLFAIARTLGVSESYIRCESDDPCMMGKAAELEEALLIIARHREAMTCEEKTLLAAALFKETSPMPSQEEPSGCPTCRL